MRRSTLQTRLRETWLAGTPYPAIMHEADGRKNGERRLSMVAERDARGDRLQRVPGTGFVTENMRFGA